jgi:hypothetical protein
MAQSLELNIKTTSDVPKAMDKAKQATVAFRQAGQDIAKKFGTSFKDIFLSALGPMALVASAAALIGKLIADNQKKQEERKSCGHRRDQQSDVSRGQVLRK